VKFSLSPTAVVGYNNSCLASIPLAGFELSLIGRFSGVPRGLGERHLRQVLRSWVTHYNHARVHMSLGPGIPAPLTPSPPENPHRHRLPANQMIRSKAVLGGLHHEYWLEKIAA
jgi:hypothetical protein